MNTRNAVLLYLSVTLFLFISCSKKNPASAKTDDGFRFTIESIEGGTYTPLDTFVIIGDFTGFNDSEYVVVADGRSIPVISHGPDRITTVTPIHGGDSDVDFAVAIAGIDPLRPDLSNSVSITVSPMPKKYATPGKYADEVAELGIDFIDGFYGFIVGHPALLPPHMDNTDAIAAVKREFAGNKKILTGLRAAIDDMPGDDKRILDGLLLMANADSLLSAIQFASDGLPKTATAADQDRFNGFYGCLTGDFCSMILTSLKSDINAGKRTSMFFSGAQAAAPLLTLFEMAVGMLDNVTDAFFITELCSVWIELPGSAPDSMYNLSTEKTAFYGRFLMQSVCAGITAKSLIDRLTTVPDEELPASLPADREPDAVFSEVSSAAVRICTDYCGIAPSDVFLDFKEKCGNGCGRDLLIDAAMFSCGPDGFMDAASDAAGIELDLPGAIRAGLALPDDGPSHTGNIAVSRDLAEVTSLTPGLAHIDFHPFTFKPADVAVDDCYFWKRLFTAHITADRYEPLAEPRVFFAVRDRNGFSGTLQIVRMAAIDHSAVRIYLSILDSAGNPVRGVAAADLEMYEDGRPVAVASVAAVGADTPGAAVVVGNAGNESGLWLVAFVSGGNFDNKEHLIAVSYSGKTASEKFIYPSLPVAAPAAVTLGALQDVTDSSCRLVWSKSDDEYFGAYRIYRSTDDDVDTTAVLRAVIVCDTVTAFNDTGLLPGVKYGYRIYTCNIAGMSAGSNTEYVGGEPAAVTLFEPEGITETGVTLRWSRSKYPDFNKYRIYCDTTSGVNRDDREITSLPERSDTVYTVSGLSRNHEYWFCVYVQDGDGVWSDASNSVTVTTSSGIPAPVVLLPSENATANSISLRWRMSVETDFAEYRLYYSTNSAVDTGSTLAARVVRAADTAFTVDGLAGTTQYWFALYVTDLTGLASRASNTVTSVTGSTSAAAVTLCAPESVTADAVTLRWTMTTEERFVRYDVRYSTVPSVNGESVLAGTSATVDDTTLLLSNLDEHTAYYFRVFVIDSNGVSSGGNVRSATTLNAAPDAVALLTAVNVTAGDVTLRWNASMEGDFSGYRIYRSTGSTADTSSALVALVNKLSDTAYTVTGLDAETRYRFVVYVIDSGGMLSATSNTVDTMTAASASGAVTLLSPESITATGVLLRWSRTVDPGFISYAVYHSASSSVDETSDSAGRKTSLNDTSMTVSGLLANTTYYFRVYMKGAGNVSFGSNIQSAKTDNAPPPAAVTLSDPYNIYTTNVTLQWRRSRDTAFSSYRVYYSMRSAMDTGDMKGGTVTSVTDTTFRLYGLGDNTKYWFAVYVVNKAGVFSASSNRVSCTTKDQFPDPVTLLSLQQTSPSSVSLRWSRTVETDFAGYGVYYSTESFVHEKSTRAGAFTDPDDTTMLITELDENKTYYFRVFVNDTWWDDGAGSNTISATMPNHAPDSVKLNQPSIITAATIKCAWKNSGEADFAAYRLYWSATPTVDTGSNLITKTSKFDTTYVLSRLDERTRIWFAVYVVDSSGSISAKSNVVEAITGNLPPDAETLLPAESITTSSFTLRWTKSHEADFMRYDVFAGGYPIYDYAPNYRGSTTDADDTSMTIAGLNENNKVHVIVYVRDRDSVARGSNSDSLKLLNAVPDPVSLYLDTVTDTTVRLHWSQSGENDHKNYKLYYSETPDVSTGSMLADSTPYKGNTTFLMLGIAGPKRYWFAVYVEDDSGEISPKSNVVVNYPVILSQTAADNISATIGWTPYTGDDFQSYKVYRGISSQVNENKYKVADLSGQLSTEAVDRPLDTGAVYFYRVYCHRQDGSSQSSNLLKVVMPGGHYGGKMSYVIGGYTFQMGDPEGLAEEKPVHPVVVNSFWMDKTEVTQKEYADLMAATYDNFSPPDWNPDSTGVGDDYPASYVNWFDAALYCNARTRATGSIDTVYRYTNRPKISAGNYLLQGLIVDLTKTGFRLPTEAEWEFACRGGSDTRYYWYKDSTYYRDHNDNLIISHYAWWNGGRISHPVGKKLPNDFDLYDMSGNLWEWCNDWYESDYYGVSPSENPAGPEMPDTLVRVFRGGYCGSDSRQITSSVRGRRTPETSACYAGFRVMRPAP